MGRGYQGQGHRPSSRLIHALHQGVGAPRCVCVSHARHRGGGGEVMVAENCSGGGGLPLTEKRCVLRTFVLRGRGHILK